MDAEEIIAVLAFVAAMPALALGILVGSAARQVPGAIWLLN
jgi:hypothetical protein